MFDWLFEMFSYAFITRAVLVGMIGPVRGPFGREPY